jgi:hypothetical protein
VESGQPTTAFVRGEAKTSTIKTEAGLDGTTLNVQVAQEFTCAGDNVTSTPQTKVFEREGVTPPVGIGIGAVAAGIFAASLLSGTCNPDDPRLFDLNPDPLEGGISVGLATCDLAGGALTVLGFSAALAYGATSIKNLVSKPKPEELAPLEKKEAASQSCGREPVNNVPLLVYLPNDKGLSYAWPDENGKAVIDISTLVDPSVAAGKMTVAFATAPSEALYTADEAAVGGLRPSGWSPVVTSGALSGSAQITTSWYELSDKNDSIRHIKLNLKVKNPGTAPASFRGRLVSDHPGINARNYVWVDVAPGSELEKVVEIDLPKALPDPGRLDVYLIEKSGQVAAKASATNGPPPPPPPAPVVEPPKPAPTPAPAPAPAPKKGGKTK